MRQNVITFLSVIGAVLHLFVFMSFQLVTAQGNGPPFHQPTGVAIEADGHLVVLDSLARDGVDAIVRVDPFTGDRSIISDSTTGSGPLFSGLSIAVEANGGLITVGGLAGIFHVYRIDPVSGDRTRVLTEGPPFRFPTDIALAPDGTLMVLDVGYPAVLRIDLETGTRSIVSSDTIGTGRLLGLVDSVAVDPIGSIFVGSLFTILQLDPVTGDRRIASGGFVTLETIIFVPKGLAVESTGMLVMVDSLQRRVTRIDPVSGVATVLSSSQIGGGPPLVLPRPIAVEADGMLIVTDISLQAVIRIDPLTGDRVTLSRSQAVLSETEK